VALLEQEHNKHLASIEAKILGTSSMIQTGDNLRVTRSQMLCGVNGIEITDFVLYWVMKPEPCVIKKISTLTTQDT
jgi:hypothetical protein